MFICISRSHLYFISLMTVVKLLCIQTWMMEKYKKNSQIKFIFVGHTKCSFFEKVFKPIENLILIHNLPDLVWNCICIYFYVLNLFLHLSFIFALAKHYILCHVDEVNPFEERKTWVDQIRFAKQIRGNINSFKSFKSPLGWCKSDI